MCYISQHPAELRPPSSPTQGPIAKCITTVRNLALSTKTLHRAFRDAGRHIARINDPRRATFQAEWSTVTRRYKSFIDDSDIAAGKLAAIINIYLALQGNTHETQEASVSTELLTLQSASIVFIACQQELENCNYIFSGPCANLRNDIETFFLKLVGRKVDTQDDETASPLNSPLDARIAPLPAPQESQPEPAGQGSASAKPTPSRMWSLLTDRLPALNATLLSSRSPAAAESTLTAAQAAAVGHFARATGGHTQVQQQRRHVEEATGPAQSQAQAPTISDKPLVDVVIASMKDIMLSLATQSPQLDVFRELTLHLKNEIRAYLQALQSAKAFPTADKRTALANMQARVALSSAHWRACVSALTDGYSRIQK
ncbi:hypothetical protein GY45DRAFT_1361278 [Cubamyces sp. BRFM 1775]|nr:hypothetical protein GY45DRAFT_1361278 [Cubamyces sp. BRFM 1775]